MTGDQSRSLIIGARVRWNADKADLVTVIPKDWSAVTIKWDSGESTHNHNDMVKSNEWVIANAAQT